MYYRSKSCTLSDSKWNNNNNINSICTPHALTPKQKSIEWRRMTYDIIFPQAVKSSITSSYSYIPGSIYIIEGTTVQLSHMYHTAIYHTYYIYVHLYITAVASTWKVIQHLAQKHADAHPPPPSPWVSHSCQRVCSPQKWIYIYINPSWGPTNPQDARSKYPVVEESWQKFPWKIVLIAI